MGPLIWYVNAQVRMWIILDINYKHYYHLGKSQICAGAGDYFRISNPHSEKLWNNMIYQICVWPKYRKRLEPEEAAGCFTPDRHHLSLSSKFFVTWNIGKWSYITTLTSRCKRLSFEKTQSGSLTNITLSLADWSSVHTRYQQRWVNNQSGWAGILV